VSIASKEDTGALFTFFQSPCLVGRLTASLFPEISRSKSSIRSPRKLDQGTNPGNYTISGPELYIDSSNSGASPALWAAKSRFRFKTCGHFDLFTVEPMVKKLQPLRAFRNI
jgi:hypothetical protein